MDFVTGNTLDNGEQIFKTFPEARRYLYNEVKALPWSLDQENALSLISEAQGPDLVISVGSAYFYIESD